jgi:ribonuclease-3
LPPITRLLEKLEYQFRDESLLQQALSHRSAGASNYERLEFLGDSILNFVIAEELFHKFTSEDEGSLSRMRASIVRGETLAEVARRLELSEHLIMGPGELRSGGFRRDSILADVVEALIGAVYIEAGLETSRQLVLRLMRDKLDHISPEANLKDPKTRLQEFLQARQWDLPDYQVQETSGEQHAQTFTVECKVTGIDETVTGRGKSRKKAEQRAAQMMLELLESND